MLTSINDIIGCGIQALDGEIGKVKDFYFDDVKWTVRYLIADTRKWLPGRKVLISPEATGEYDWIEGETLPILLTKRQIENSPEIDEDTPVSRQHEQAIADFFQWSAYWKSHVITGTPSDAIASAAEYVGEPEGDPNLRSISEVTGYQIQATDDDIGHIEDFIIRTNDWSIRYIVVDTKKWLPGKKVILPPGWIGPISWKDKQVTVDMPSEHIKNSPEFDPTRPVTRKYETRLYDYYGRPAYWYE
jgi:uncharacterized protein YrrD